MSNNLNRPKPTTTPFKKVLTLHFTRKFTWKERIKILFGGEASMKETILTQFSPGEYEAAMTLDVH